MSVVGMLDDLRGWLEKNVCPKVELKVPDDKSPGESYDHQLAHPAAFVMFMPSKDRLPPVIQSPIPSICVQMVEGTDSLIEHTRSLKVRLCFSAWSPGRHRKDIYVAEEKGERYHLAGPENEEAFRRDSEGWMHVWNFLDTALRIIEGEEILDGMRLEKEKGIKYGLFTEQNAVPDFYPYWFAWAELSIQEGLERIIPPSYEQYL